MTLNDLELVNCSRYDVTLLFTIIAAVAYGLFDWYAYRLPKVETLND